MNLSRHNRFFLPCTQLLILLLLGLFVSPLCADPGVGDRAPSWRLSDVDGETLRFPQEINADYSLVVFWAAWCPYCKALMPRLASLQQEIGVDRLPVLALRLEVPDGNGGSMLVPEGFRMFENAWDVAEDYSVSMLPGLFLVRNGRIVYRLDYPAADHPSQQMAHGAAQAALLGQWWEQRLRDVLRDEGLALNSG